MEFCTGSQVSSLSPRIWRTTLSWMWLRIWDVTSSLITCSVAICTTDFGRTVSQVLTASLPKTGILVFFVQQKHIFPHLFSCRWRHSVPPGGFWIHACNTAATGLSVAPIVGSIHALPCANQTDNNFWDGCADSCDQSENFFQLFFAFLWMFCAVFYCSLKRLFSSTVNDQLVPILDNTGQELRLNQYGDEFNRVCFVFRSWPFSCHVHIRLHFVSFRENLIRAWFCIMWKMKLFLLEDFHCEWSDIRPNQHRGLQWNCTHGAHVYFPCVVDRQWRLYWTVFRPVFTGWSHGQRGPLGYTQRCGIFLQAQFCFVMHLFCCFVCFGSVQKTFLGDGPFTVFAPINDAFDGVDITDPEELTGKNVETLFEPMLGHKFQVQQSFSLALRKQKHLRSSSPCSCTRDSCGCWHLLHRGTDQWPRAEFHQRPKYQSYTWIAARYDKWVNATRLRCLYLPMHEWFRILTASDKEGFMHGGNLHVVSGKKSCSQMRVYAPRK